MLNKLFSKNKNRKKRIKDSTNKKRKIIMKKNEIIIDNKLVGTYETVEKLPKSNDLKKRLWANKRTEWIDYNSPKGKLDYYTPHKNNLLKLSIIENSKLDTPSRITNIIYKYLEKC